MARDRPVIVTPFPVAIPARLDIGMSSYVYSCASASSTTATVSSMSPSEWASDRKPVS